MWRQAFSDYSHGEDHITVVMELVGDAQGQGCPQASPSGTAVEVSQTRMGWKEFELIIVVKKLKISVLFFFPPFLLIT